MRRTADISSESEKILAAFAPPMAPRGTPSRTSQEVAPKIEALNPSLPRGYRIDVGQWCAAATPANLFERNCGTATAIRGEACKCP